MLYGLLHGEGIRWISWECSHDLDTESRGSGTLRRRVVFPIPHSPPSVIHSSQQPLLMLNPPDPLAIVSLTTLVYFLEEFMVPSLISCTLIISMLVEFMILSSLYSILLYEFVLILWNSCFSRCNHLLRIILQSLWFYGYAAYDAVCFLYSKGKYNHFIFLQFLVFLELNGDADLNKHLFLKRHGIFICAI